MNANRKSSTTVDNARTARWNPLVWRLRFAPAMQLFLVLKLWPEHALRHEPAKPVNVGLRGIQRYASLDLARIYFPQ
jgi:hypothetical protein